MKRFLIRWAPAGDINSEPVGRTMIEAYDRRLAVVQFKRLYPDKDVCYVIPLL